MKSTYLRPRAIAAAVAALVAASSLSSFARSPVLIDDATAVGKGPIGLSATDAPARYIVRFVEAPVAQYNSYLAARGGVAGIGTIPSRMMNNGRVRLDVHSTQAQAYVQYVKTQQQQHLTDISNTLNVPVKPKYAMQHALNAVVLELTPAQVAQVAQVQGVEKIERDMPHAPATDIGPGFIGASSVWFNAPASQDTIYVGNFDTSQTGFKGDGLVVGDIDTGYNSMSPSFQVADAVGYSVSNPLGTGVFLGQCNVANISLAGCNDKVIGVYDEIDLTNSGGPFTAYSVEDVQGHGSHTASTAAGDYRAATLGFYNTTLSGVAPHANLVIYYACSPDPNVQCSTAATTASVDQAIQDQVVDALNYSISGGTDPWNDSTSLAFLSAANAGIFVAAAAGNTSASVPNQVAGTANHWEPWVTTVAAGTHTGGPVAPTVTITGPGSPPPSVQNLPLNETAGDTPQSGAVTSPIVLSPNFFITNTSGSDGCAAYPANAFQGAIALVSRGTCSFYVKVENAIAAGATAVIISDNRPEVLQGFTVADPVNGAQPVTAWAITQASGAALQTFLAANSNTGAAYIPYPATTRQAQQPDVLAGFSLLGPITFNVIKPDVQAPGVSILAAVANDGSPGGENAVALYNGTSMATPHTTGSGILMLGTNPNWSPLEAKSALMMTALEAGLTKANTVTPSNFFDRGSGRIQDFPASKAGLVLDENALNFDYADPSQGGDPSKLNLASMQNFACINSCNFSRTFVSSATGPVTWTVAVTGAVGTPTPSVASFLINPGAGKTLGLSLDTSALASDNATHFGELTLTPSDTSLATLHLPIAIRVPKPTIKATPNPVTITGVGITSASASLNVANIGGPTLNVAQNTSATGVTFVRIDQQTPFTYGFTSTQYAGKEPGTTDYFASDDFTITGANTVDLSKIYVPGFTQAPNPSLANFGPGLQLHWRIFSDAGGKPSGDPDNGGALWSFDATASTTGVTIGTQFQDDITLDTVAAGAPATALPAGHYWLVVYPTFPCLGNGQGCTTGQWYWLTSSTGSGSSAVTIAPQGPTPVWTAIDPSTGKGLAMHLESKVSCVPPVWLSQTGLPAAIGGASSTNVTVTATSPLGASSATAYLCLSSNDTAHPLVPIQVNAAQ